METICPHCGRTFVVPPAMKGGIANCPDCGRAVEISGRSEGMYWALLGLAGLGVLAAAAAGFAVGGPAAGTTVLGLGVLAVIAVAFLAQ